MQKTRARRIGMAATATLATAILAGPEPLAAQSGADVARTYREAHEVEILHDFAELLSYPNRAFTPDIVRAAEYIRGELERGVPIRFIEQDGKLAACASADIIPVARTAELTDCATLPDHHGKGFMRAILLDLMEDLRQMNYPTAFTLARARIPGVNIVFQRLGFEFQGRMRSSCLIGDGIEDMNILSRAL